MEESEAKKVAPGILYDLQRNNNGLEQFGPCLCGKLLPTREYQKKYYSGFINFTGILCSDCLANFKGHSRIVCVGCRRLMGFFEPQRDRSGFVFERDKCYHIAECPKCNNDVRATPVMELERYYREQHMRTDADQDIVQEIEQKRLQGEREADKLRSDFNNSNEDKSP